MNKECLILGSNSDVGQALAYRFAREGYNISLATRNVDEFQRTLAADIGIRTKVVVRNYQFDAALFSSHAGFYSSLDTPPDVVISVFGLLGDQMAARNDFNLASSIITANYTGQVSILNIIANDMEQRKQGMIIGISSVAGERGRQSNYIYGSAKAGFTAYLSGLRNRLVSAGVHVMTVKPGFIRTRMTEGMPLPARLTASPEQVANSIWKAAGKKKNSIYILSVWRLIMFIIRNIPEGIFKKLKL